ncbi:TspO/MBR family protein [Aquimarina rhabdastrellae]
MKSIQGIKNFLVFLVLNFAALALGIYLMDNGPRSLWYANLDKAPWSPPNALFGIAWSFIMICFAVYMAQLWHRVSTKKVVTLYSLQWILNVSWNYIFFNQHYIILGVIILIALQIVLILMTSKFKREMNLWSLLILPYIIWMCIAISLNVYVI